MRVGTILRVFLFFVALSLLTTAVAAGQDLSFSTEMRAINRTISPDGTAIIEIDVTNHMSSSQNFRIRTPDFRWDLLSRPRSDYFSGFNVPGDSTYTLNLEYSPRGDLVGGRYTVRTQIDSRTSGESTFVDVPIDVRTEREDREYATTVVINAGVNNDDTIDPRQTSRLVIDIDNRNPLNISRLDVEIESPFINESFDTPLPPLDNVRSEFNFDVDELQEPGVYDFRVVVRYDGEAIGRTPMTFPVQVIPYSEIERDVSEESGFLSTRREISLRNRGNVINSDEVRVETGFFRNLFTSAEPSPQSITEDGIRYLYWDIDIPPGASARVDVGVNYRPLLYLAIIAVLASALYMMLRSPLVVKKTAATLDVKEEGISELKVLIHVRNRTPRNFVGFSVSEYVPKIATFMKSDSLGSVLPSKVLNHEKKGTLLKWNFDAIEPFEERIIIYKMKLNFAVLGKLNLPPTVVKFKDEQGTSYTSRSNRLRILNSEERDETGKKSRKKKKKE